MATSAAWVSAKEAKRRERVLPSHLPRTELVQLQPLVLPQLRHL